MHIINKYLINLYTYTYQVVYLSSTSKINTLILKKIYTHGLLLYNVGQHRQLSMDLKTELSETI